MQLSEDYCQLWWFSASYIKKNGYLCDHNNKICIMDKDINRIKVVLAEKKKTNKWLAEQLGCAPTTVSKWCTNACQPPMETYIKIAKLLEVELAELVNSKFAATN